MSNDLPKLFPFFKEKKVKIAIFIILIVGIILLIDLIPSTAPEKVYIRVLQADNITPEQNAFCKENLIISNKTYPGILGIEKQLIIDCYTQNCMNKSYEEGYYHLDTGLKNYRGQFEIKIVCITPTGVSYTILNNTHIPCEIMDEGASVRCTAN